MDKPSRELDREDIPYISSKLKSFLFPLLRRDLMFSDDSHIFLVMASIDVFRPSFDVEVELPPCLSSNEFRDSRHGVVDTVSLDQIFILNSQ